MDERARDDDTQGSGSGSIVSGLTSLENENDADDFDRLMVQNARDERRLQDALRGSIQPFRKARTHPRVGLTLENLERQNAQNGVGLVERGQAKFESPPSSSGSARSDPAIRLPAQWGRKGRPRRDWLRSAMAEEEQSAGAQDDTIARLTQDDTTPRQTDRAARTSDADIPRASIEDSPLSHKSSLQGTPASSRRRNAHFENDHDWDLTLDFNEASMIASTPYVPRNTVLDDIRQREIESLREQAVTTNRLDKIRESSPEESRRPRSSSRQSTPNQTNGAEQITEQPAQESGSSSLRSRQRTNSWKAIGKSQTITGETGEQGPKSPILIYKKSLETVGVVDPGVSANAQASSQRPTHRREDSQDLLRRLARVSSNTPSPGRIAALRPQTAPARQSDSVSAMNSEPSQSSSKGVPLSTESFHEPATIGTAATAPDVPLSQKEAVHEPPNAQHTLSSSQQQDIVDVDATPMPIEPSQLNAKTPRVTGAWVDTIIEEPSKFLSRSPKKSSPRKKSPQKGKTPQQEQQVERAQTAIERTRPTLPGSALEAIVEEARANGRTPRHQDQLGDSTIDSLEELIGPNVSDSENPDVDFDEDTLQGLQLPTNPPRNEAERQRQQELTHLHRMNQRLRAARTSIRDASRGMKRVENRVDQVEEIIESGGEKIRVIYRDSLHGHICSPWSTAWASFKRMFYMPESPRRRGLTWFSIFVIALFVWWISELLAWYVAHSLSFIHTSHFIFFIFYFIRIYA